MAAEHTLVDEAFGRSIERQAAIFQIVDRLHSIIGENDRRILIDEIVAAGFDRPLVERIIQLVDRNEYKRRQAPPGIKITRRAFGRDRRYPLTNGF